MVYSHLISCHSLPQSSFPYEVCEMIGNFSSPNDHIHIASSCKTFHNPISRKMFRTFSLSQTSTSNDIRVMISHSSHIHLLKVDSYSFLSEMFLLFPCLKHVSFARCCFSSLDFMVSTMPRIESVSLQQCCVQDFCPFKLFSSLPHLQTIQFSDKVYSRQA